MAAPLPALPTKAYDSCKIQVLTIRKPLGHDHRKDGITGRAIGCEVAPSSKGSTRRCSSLEALKSFSSGKAKSSFIFSPIVIFSFWFFMVIQAFIIRKRKCGIRRAGAAVIPRKNAVCNHQRNYTYYCFNHFITIGPPTVFLSVRISDTRDYTEGYGSLRF